MISLPLVAPLHGAAVGLFVVAFLARRHDVELTVRSIPVLGDVMVLRETILAILWPVKLLEAVSTPAAPPFYGEVPEVRLALAHENSPKTDGAPGGPQPIRASDSFPLRP